MERHYFRNGIDWVGESCSSIFPIWEELKSEVRWAEFTEQTRTAAWITLHDPARKILVSVDECAITLLHKREYSVLQLSGHPPNNCYSPGNPGDGDAAMLAADAIGNPSCCKLLVEALQ